MIRIKNIAKKYGDQIALKDINFSSAKGNIISVIGPSGSGKSTLLRIIAGLEKADEGNLYIDDEKVTKRNLKKCRKKIGMVFQNFHLFPHMNVIENLTYAPKKVLGMNSKEAKDKAKDYLKQFGLSAKIKAMPNGLSGGQKQRVSIIRSLMMNPEIILFDEPTSALDPEKVRDVAELIKSLKQNMLVIVVTHHIALAKAVSDRIIFMAEGQILGDQESDSFFAKPKSHRARLFLEKVEDF
jgi:polar amino acid transport system ATP-binding protein